MEVLYDHSEEGKAGTHKETIECDTVSEGEHGLFVKRSEKSELGSEAGQVAYIKYENLVQVTP